MPQYMIYSALALHEEVSSMSVAPLVRAVEETQLRDDRPDLQSGDTVRVHLKVVEGTRERIQVFEGIVIRLRGDNLRRAFNSAAHRAQRGRRAQFSPGIHPQIRQDRS